MLPMILKSIAIICLTSLFYTQAQEISTDSIPQRIRQLKMYPLMYSGAFSCDVTPLNRYFSPKGYGRIRDFCFNTGFGISSMIYSNTSHEIQLQQLVWLTKSAPIKTMQLQATLFAYNVGLRLIQTPAQTFLAFLLGAGIGKSFLYLSSSSVSLDSLIESTTSMHHHTLKQNTILLHSAFHIEKPLKTSTPYPLSIGVRAGFYIDLSHPTNWYEDACAIRSTPKLLITGPYISLVISSMVMI